jgi:hypothetical protein
MLYIERTDAAAGARETKTEGRTAGISAMVLDVVRASHFIAPDPDCTRKLQSKAVSLDDNGSIHMANWKGIVGTSFSPQDFDAYCRSLSWNSWRPRFIVLHNTASPSLAQRPNGLTHQHILNLERYYRDEKGWSAGPHLFVDDKQIWVFTPLTTSGVHSPSWNSTALGVEMLGDYEHESFNSGRGLKVRQNAVSAMASLSAALGLDPTTMRLHKEDPATTHACPGKNVKKLEVIQEVQDRVCTVCAGEHTFETSGKMAMLEAAMPPYVTARKAGRKRKAKKPAAPTNVKKTAASKKLATSKKARGVA